MTKRVTLKYMYEIAIISQRLLVVLTKEQYIVQ